MVSERMERVDAGPRPENEIYLTSTLRRVEIRRVSRVFRCLDGCILQTSLTRSVTGQRLTGIFAPRTQVDEFRSQ